MKGYIKRLLRENLLDEVSNELYAKIKREHHNDRLIISKYDSLDFDMGKIGQQEVRTKPRGLWYGIGDSWLSWVKSEMPDWEYDNVYKIEVDKSKIKIIRTYDELVAFDGEYGVDYESRIVLYNGRNIDWGKVANDFGGIEISPYIYKARYEFNWYYGWDVASGCIWSNDVITDIKKLN